MTQACKGHVVQDRLVENQTVALPVLGHESDPLLNCLRGTCDADGLPLDQYLARSASTVRAKDCHQKVAAAGTHQTGDTQHLSAANCKADPVDQAFARRDIFD